MGYRELSTPETPRDEYGIEESVPLTNTAGGGESRYEKQPADQIPSHLEPYLQTKPTFGLSDNDVSERLEKFGRNELQEKKKNKIKQFLMYCKTRHIY
jgi:H+-transporting ATPase